MYDSIEEIHSVSEFEIFCAGGGLPDPIEDRTKSGLLYGNGRHQIEVIVRMKAINSEHKALKLDPEIFLSRIYLCDYHTGVTIQYASEQYLASAEVYYTDAKTEYCHTMVSTQDPDHDDMNVVRYYISVTGENIEARIACRFVLSYDEDSNALTYIDTTGRHLNQKLPNGSPFEEQSHVTIRARKPYDYSDSRNLVYHGAWRSMTDFTKIADRLYLYRETGNHTRNGDFWALSEWAGCHIRPSDPNCVFTWKEVIRCGEGARFTGPSGREADVMKISGGSCDIISSAPRSGLNGYQASLIFVDRFEYGVQSGSIYYEAASGTRNETIYSIADTDTAHSWQTTVPTDSIRIDFCNHVADDNRELTRWAWKDVNTGPNEGVTVKVFDNYGNSGDIYISMGPWPRLRINGAAW